MSSRIKGATLINTIGVVKEAVGPTKFNQLVASCPMETQQLLRRTLMAVEWVDVDVWGPFLQGIFTEVAASDETKFRRVMRLVYKRDFSSIYRAHMQGVTPANVFSKPSVLWSAYFDSGSMQTQLMQKDGSSVLATVQLESLDSQSVIYPIALHAFVEQIFATAGVQNLMVSRRKETRRGSQINCEYLVSFA